MPWPPNVPWVSAADAAKHSRRLCKFRIPVGLLFAVCVGCEELSYPRKSRFGQQASSAEAFVIFTKGHETLTNARQPIPVPSASLELQLGPAGRSDRVPVTVQSITCLCKKELKMGSCFLAHSRMRNLSYLGDRRVSSQTSFTLVR